MRVLALASQKGGSGKTTLAGHLAVEASRSGAGPVVLIDIDPNGTLGEWWEARTDDDPAFAQTSLVRLGSDLDVLRREGFRLALIDTPPASTIAIQSAIQHADLVVVPVRPSPHDLRASGSMIELCERAGKPAAFVMNGTGPGADLTEQVASALVLHGTVVPTQISHAPLFASAMSQGEVVAEAAPDSPSAWQMRAVWNDICQRLEENFRRTVFSQPQAGQPLFQRQTIPTFGRRGVA
jgi:chromosome partitioning protein